MARHSIHNRRAGRGSSGGGASWISYSDVMAALLLVFVLILCVSLYQYFTMLETKQAELEEQRSLVAAQQVTLTQKQTELDTQTAALLVKQNELDSANAILADKESELAALQLELLTQKNELEAANSLLLSQQEALASQQEALAAQTARIDALVGIRSEIITTLSNTLSSAGLRAKVDPNGSILLDSAVFFQTGSYVIKEEGQALLNAFVPVYLSVLLREEYQDYLGEIIIEGHTDTSGTYMKNLELSQNRALAVAKYVLEMEGLSEAQRALLRNILTATGRSYSDPIYNSNGTVNMDASRRVEFKFNLKDAEMIAEMNRLLNQDQAVEDHWSIEDGAAY